MSKSPISFRFLRRWLPLLLVFLTAATPGFAALSGATVWECRASGASDTNGGGFVAGSGGTDDSQQNAAQVAVGGGTVTSSITGTTVTFTGSTYTVLAGDVGNIVQFISGTNVTAGFYQITAVSAGLNGTWTLDRTPLTSGTTTNAVANMGGALATLAKVAGAYIFGNRIYATGAFSSSATTTFANGGSPSAITPGTRIIGYGSTRTDGVHASLTLSTNTGLTGINVTGNGITVENFDVNCSSLGTSIGISTGSTNFSTIRNCKASNFTSSGITNNGTNGSSIQDCEATGGTSAASAAINVASGFTVLRCFVHDNACSGIVGSSTGEIADNLIVNNSGASSDGINVTYGVAILNNTVHNNGRHGASVGMNIYVQSAWRNNIFSNNGGFGITVNTGTAIGADTAYDGNAFFSNTSGARGNMDSTAGIYGVNPYVNVRDVTLTASPYVGPTTGASANFALNNAAGAGAACRQKASPGTWPGNTGSTGFLDMGAVQSKGARGHIIGG